jgi:hypothetical protein
MGLRMTTRSGQEPVEPASKAEETVNVPQGIKRFAQYTSPVMLAMLASAGKDMAFAQFSNP